MSPHPASQCTPSHCTWGELGAMYSSASFLVGLAVIAAVAALLFSRRTRRTGWILVPLLLVIGVIGISIHHPGSA
jgi:hypothetical protein